MKTTIREGVFETNSSSTHSLVMMEESEFKKWKDGKLFYNEDNYIPQANRKLDKELDALYKDHSEFYTKKEIEDLKKQLSEAREAADAKIKNYNKDLVASLKESDKSSEEVELLKEANKALEDRLAEVRASIKESAEGEDFKAKYEELKESYDTLSEENKVLMQRKDNIKKSANEKITESEEYIKDLEEQNKTLKESLDKFGN